MMFHEGTIGIPVKGSDKMKVAHYRVNAYGEDSDFGINGGRISKLIIKIDGKVVVSYERGWDVEPDENDQDVMVAYYILLKEYN